MTAGETPRLIVILGLGALGSHVTLALRNLAGVKIRAVDDDRVEAKNALSQFYGRTENGKGKAQATARQHAFLFGGKIEAVPHRLTGENVREILEGAALAIDCFDNAPSRRIVRDFCLGAGIPCLHGALSNAAERYGRVAWAEDFEIDEGAAPGTPTCLDGGALPHIFAVAACLGFAVDEFFRSGRRIAFEVPPGGPMRIR